MLMGPQQKHARRIIGVGENDEEAQGICTSSSRDSPLDNLGVNLGTKKGMKNLLIKFTVSATPRRLPPVPPPWSVSSPADSHYNASRLHLEEIFESVGHGRRIVGQEEASFGA